MDDELKRPAMHDRNACLIHEESTMMPMRKRISINLRDYGLRDHVSSETKPKQVDFP